MQNPAARDVRLRRGAPVMFVPQSNQGAQNGSPKNRFAGTLPQSYNVYGSKENTANFAKDLGVKEGSSLSWREPASTAPATRGSRVKYIRAVPKLIVW